MRAQNQSSMSSCNIHPVEFIEGVCPLCLNERLLELASLQKRCHTIQESPKKKSIRLFSFLGFFELRLHKKDHQTTSSISPEDSFISIKFEDNGATSREKEKEQESSHLENCKALWDHQYRQPKPRRLLLKWIIRKTKPRRLLLKWRKRISRLVHVISFRNRGSAKVKGDDGLSRSWLRHSPSTKKKAQN